MKKILIILVVLTLFFGLIWFFENRQKRKMTVSSYNQAVTSGLIIDVLTKVISRDYESKKYTDVISLDGGTVGIAHYAVGGLASLYELMDTQKYFGKTKTEMINNYSTGCKNNSCYNMSWWRTGMENFVKSSESKSIQNAAYINKVKDTVETVISKGWTTPRKIAIAIGVSNSLGYFGFTSLASKNNYDAEKTLIQYAGTNEHRLRRVEAINKNYPL